MEQQTPTPPPPSLPTTTVTTTATVTTTTSPDSLDSSPHSRNTDSWNEDNNNSHFPSNNGTTSSIPPVSLTSTKLRLMCSYGGHIVPRPHDKSLCYVGGDTRMVVVDRHTNLSDLIHRLSKTLMKSSSSSLTSSLNSVTASFTVKYQLPTEDLDSLISVTTDEDLENMIDEYERLNLLFDVNKTSRIRLFLFPVKPDSVSSIGSLMENSSKSEDWFLNALNGTTSGFSDTSSVNCLLGLDDDVVLVSEKKYVQNVENGENGENVENKGVVGKSLKGNNSGQDVHSVPDLERTSSFGSASSAPSMASLPPIRVHVEDNLKVGGIEEQFSQMSVQQQYQKVQHDGGYVAAPAPVVVMSVPPSSSTSSTPRVLAEDERSENGLQHGYQSNQQLYQQKQSAGFDLASMDSVSSDGRQKPAMIYQDQLLNIQSSNNNRTSDMNNIPDQNTRIQVQQHQVSDSGYMMSMSNTQVDPQGQLHPQMHHQQPQFINTAVPQPQYFQHHPSGAVPMASYYQMYPPQNQRHPQHSPVDQQNFVYFMPTMQAPHGYNVQLQQQATGNQAPPSAYTTTRVAQTAPKSENASQFVQVPSGQHQPQPQYAGYSQIHHTPQSVANSGAGVGANYGYEFTEPAQGQPFYYAAQPMPPQSAAQYQTVTASNAQYQTVTAEAGSYLPTVNSPKQQGRTQQP